MQPLASNYAMHYYVRGIMQLCSFGNFVTLRQLRSSSTLSACAATGFYHVSTGRRTSYGCTTKRPTFERSCPLVTRPTYFCVCWSHHVLPTFVFVSHAAPYALTFSVRGPYVHRAQQAWQMDSTNIYRRRENRFAIASRTYHTLLVPPSNICICRHPLVI